MDCPTTKGDRAEQKPRITRISPHAASVKGDRAEHEPQITRIPLSYHQRSRSTDSPSRHAPRSHGPGFVQSRGAELISPGYSVPEI